MRSTCRADERGQREDHAGREAFARCGGGLHRVVLQDVAAAQSAKDRHRDHGGGHRRRDGHAGEHAEVRVRAGEDHGQEAAEEDHADRELGQALARRDVRLDRAWGFTPRTVQNREHGRTWREFRRYVGGKSTASLDRTTGQCVINVRSRHQRVSVVDSLQKLMSKLAWLVAASSSRAATRPINRTGPGASAARPSRSAVRRQPSAVRARRQAVGRHARTAGCDHDKPVEARWLVDVTPLFAGMKPLAPIEPVGVRRSGLAPRRRRTGRDDRDELSAPPSDEHCCRPAPTPASSACALHAGRPVPLAPELSITFSQPMVAITSQDDAARVQPVKLTPQPKGAWRWIGTRTIVFDPDPRFPQATRITLRFRRARSRRPAACSVARSSSRSRRRRRRSSRTGPTKASRSSSTRRCSRGSISDRSGGRARADQAQGRPAIVRGPPADRGGDRGERRRCAS